LNPVPKIICQEFALWNFEVPVTTLLPLYRIALLSADWFDALPGAVRQSVLNCARRRDLEAGHRLYARGDASTGVFCVLKGCVRISGVSRDGNETVLDFYGPKAWFGEVAMLDGSVHAYEAVVVAPSVVLHFAPDVFEELLEKHPSFSRGLLRLEAVRLRLLLAVIEAYGSQTLEQRLANRLLMLSGSFGIKEKNGTTLDLHLPQETLAQLIGATRQRVNQILKEWTAEGRLSHQYGRIIVHDTIWFERLSQI